MIMPYAHNWHSTTAWVYDASDEPEISYPKGEDYQFLKTDLVYFFYEIDINMLTSALPLMKLTNFTIRNRLREKGIEFDRTNYPHYIKENTVLNEELDDPPCGVPVNIYNDEDRPELHGFSLFEYFTMLSLVANEIHYLKLGEDVRPDYLTDFDTYGFFVLEVNKR